MASNKATGRPPKYTCKEEIEEKIEQYFKDCEGYPLTDEEGKPVLNKWGRPVILNERPPTVTGLALALGFSTRTSLLNYQGKKEFMDTITRAKTRVEQYAEERLYDRDGVNGAKFSLKNNFNGWCEDPKSKLDVMEQEARIEKLKTSDPGADREDGVTIVNDAPG